MKHSAEFHRCLAESDVAGVRRLAAHVFPGQKQPRNDHEALAMLHLARTQMMTMPFKLRAYSHRWLLDHNLPSTLPDRLKPKAERLYPTMVGVVGISVNSGSDLLNPIVPIIHGAMVDAVQEAYANGKTDPAFVKGRMMEARKAAVKKLLGRGVADGG